ncbi:unnamed protein product [Alternaria sp. RS040]
MQADPGQSPMGWDTEPPSGVQASGPCDLCFIKNLQKQAGSPYYDGPQIRENSLYESKTSSCGVTGYPLSISSLPFPQLPVASPTPTSSVCSGEEYDIQTGDDCYNISKSQSIGTAWLLSDNSLTAYCADFPQNGKLCIKNTCKVYTVQPADTCELMASSNNITIAQLKAWNPIINAGCHNLYKMNGTSICVSNPGVAYVTPPAMPPLAPSTAVSAAPVPTNAKDESNRQCGRWYNVESGDYCNLVTMRYAIAMADFVFLNPSINANCTNLLLDISYCVAPVGDINTYSGRPGYHTPGPSGLPFTKVTFTPTKPATTTSTPTQLSLATDTRDDCYQYFDASQMESDMTGTLYRHQCDLAADVYGVEVSELLTWNPSLGNDTEALTCSFKPGVRYCGRFYFEPPKASPEVGTSLDFPIRTRDPTSPQTVSNFSPPVSYDYLNLTFLTMSNITGVNAVLGKDFVKLNGPDNYNEWVKNFTDICSIHGYTDYYNGDDEIPAKPTLLTYAASNRPKRSTVDTNTTDIEITDANITDTDTDTDTKVKVKLSPQEATAELQLYYAQLQAWKDWNKTSRTALALLKASVKPWVWSEIPEEDQVDPKLAWDAICLTNKPPDDVTVDRALAKLDKLNLSDPVDVRSHITHAQELHNDITLAHGTLTYAQLISKINNSLLHQYSLFVNHWKLTYYNISITELVFKQYKTMLYNYRDDNKDKWEARKVTTTVSVKNSVPTVVSTQDLNTTDQRKPYAAKCEHCGNLGHSIDTCRWVNKPDAPKCAYCKKIGHVKDTCRKKARKDSTLDPSSKAHDHNTAKPANTPNADLAVTEDNNDVFFFDRIVASANNLNDHCDIECLDTHCMFHNPMSPTSTDSFQNWDNLAHARGADIQVHRGTIGLDTTDSLNTLALTATISASTPKSNL